MNYLGMRNLTLLFTVCLSFLMDSGIMPQKSDYMSAYKYKLVKGMDNQIYATINGKPEAVGAVIFNFEDDPQLFIPSEAPFSVEGFLDIVFTYNVNIYVTLTDEMDNRPAKLKFLRHSDQAFVNRHHLDRIKEGEKFGSGRYVINHIKQEQETPVKVYSAIATEVITGKSKKIFHVKYDRWPDKTAIKPDALAKLVETISHYTDKHPGTIFVNCVMGVGRTRALIIALHLYNLYRKKIELGGEEFFQRNNSKILSKQFFQKNYNYKTRRGGEFTADYILHMKHKHMRKSQFGLLCDFEKHLLEKIVVDKKPLSLALKK